MSAAESTPVVKNFRELGARLRNWNRWGPDDERGTLNHVTPEKIAAAAALVRRGAVFELGIPIDNQGPAGFRPAPTHLMTQTCCDMGNGTAYADDFICMHLQSATQWDALSHWNYDGKMYNGFPATSVLVTGTKRLGIEKMTGGVTGRGVLLDVAGLKGQKWLDTGYVITPADLEECEKRQQVRVGPGDILCFRTGWRTKFLEDGAATWMNGEPGLGLDCCEWLHSREVGAVCSDNWGIEAFPSEDPATIAPVHCVLLRDMGMPLGEIFDFEALADDCRKDGVWDFWFSAPPLKVTGGVGSPLNPIAVK